MKKSMATFWTILDKVISGSSNKPLWRFLIIVLVLLVAPGSVAVLWNSNALWVVVELIRIAIRR
jgi:hypothetical protein